MSIIHFTGSEHFRKEELASPDTGEALIEEALIENLEKIRVLLDFPLHVTSGYRTEYWNKKVGGSPHSYHMKGKAVDLAVSLDKAFDVIKVATELGFNGVGIQQKLGTDLASRFIHLDLRDYTERTVWSY